MATDQPIDLLGATGTGPVWGMASSDLNATVLNWPPGHEVAEHVNDERDVLMVVLEGDAEAIVDGISHRVPAGHALLLPKGTSRAIRAGAGGVRYLTVHLRRGPLQIQR